MMIDKLEWLSVKQLEFFHTVMTIYKMKHFNEPEYFVDKIQNVNRNGNIILNNCRLSLFRKSFSFRGPEYWNSLPSELRNISGISNFKKELKKWVMQNVQRFHDDFFDSSFIFISISGLPLISSDILYYIFLFPLFSFFAYAKGL